MRMVKLPDDGGHVSRRMFFVLFVFYLICIKSNTIKSSY